MWMLCTPHDLTKYGTAAMTVLASTNSAVFEMKYGMTMRTRPHRKGTMARCFLP